MRTIKANVKFYRGTRNSLPSINYRPHFVVNGDNELLGVEFIELDSKEYGVFGNAVVKLLYDDVGYYKLKIGVRFNIVEGTRIVGEGIVLE
ncbi:MAG: hypothetical protein NC184_02675 [Roseburia sp.]|nr:hypothetical protein [Roseburia sp.]